MKEISVLMALVDFIPVFLFGYGAIVFQRLLYDRMSKGQFALFAAGTVDIILAGALKATYKLLYGLRICDFQPLNSVFFPVQSFGFLTAGLGILAMIIYRPDKFMLKSVAPVVFTGTFIFVTMMCIGLGLMNFGLCIQAKREKVKNTVPFFIISFVFSLCMGYLSSKDFDKAYFNWIAEFVNIIGQGSFLIAALIYRKAVKARSGILEVA